MLWHEDLQAFLSFLVEMVEYCAKMLVQVDHLSPSPDRGWGLTLMSDDRNNPSRRTRDWQKYTSQGVMIGLLADPTSHHIYVVSIWCSFSPVLTISQLKWYSLHTLSEIAGIQSKNAGVGGSPITQPGLGEEATHVSSVCRVVPHIIQQGSQGVG